jgi:hypothetical protein
LKMGAILAMRFGVEVEIRKDRINSKDRPTSPGSKNSSNDKRR